jgi:hypothetical protein
MQMPSLCVRIVSSRPRPTVGSHRRLIGLWGAAGHSPQKTKRVAAQALALLSAVGMMLGGAAGLAQTTEPTSDPLRGERRLLPLDDVMVSYWPDNGAVDSKLQAGLGCSVGSPPGQGAICEYPFKLLGLTSNASLGVVAGKMFARPKDTFVVAGDDLTLTVSGGPFNSSFETWSFPLPHGLPSPVPGTAVYRPLMAMADFTGDGYDELVIGSSDQGLQVATPVDVTDPGKGLTWGDFLSPVNTVQGSALATGDFDGDGDPEVALAYPAGGGFTVEIYIVDPTELWLQFEHSVTVETSSYGHGSFPIGQVSIAAGDLDRDVSSLGPPDQEIVVAASGVTQNESRFAIRPSRCSPPCSRSRSAVRRTWPLTAARLATITRAR